ncbi:MAG: hypothetical protein ACLGXA_09610 [Acidobacteriota bacterium]
MNKLFKLKLLRCALPVSAAIMVFCSPLISMQRNSVEGRVISQQSLQGLLDDLASVPVEYRADIIFQIIQGHANVMPTRIQERALKELFEDARQAKYSAPLITADGRYGTVSHQLELAFQWSPLDALDIQSRAVSLLRRHYPIEAWTMLQEIYLPSDRATCKDSLIPEFTPYYEVMVSSLAGMPDKILPNGQSKSNWLVDQVDHISSPAQLRAFADALVQVKLSGAELSPVIDELVIRLSLISGSDREMYGAEAGREGRLTASISRLVSTEKRASIDPTSLLSTYRAFLQRNLRDAACADVSLNRPDEASAFNSIDTTLIGGPSKTVRALSAKDLSPLSTGDSASFESIDAGDSVYPQERRIGLVYQANQRVSSHSTDPDDYLQPIPQDVEDVLLAASKNRSQQDASLLSRFEDHSEILETLLIMLPPGPSYRDAVDAEMEWLNQSGVEEGSPETWLRPFKSLLQISRPITAQNLEEITRAQLKSGGQMILMPNPDAVAVRQIMNRYRSDRVISVYLSFEDIFHPNYVAFQQSLRQPPL